LSFFKELLRFLIAQKKAWLWPVFFVMILLGGLLVLSQSSAVSPFVYTLF
jgi:hypothetical protein